MSERQSKREKDPERVLRGRKSIAGREPTEAERPKHSGHRDEYVARILAGETQTAIAKEAGVSRQRVGQWLAAVGVERQASDLVAERLREKAERERLEAERAQQRRENKARTRTLRICRDALAGATVAELRYRYRGTEAEVVAILATAKIVPKRGRREGGRVSPYRKRKKKQRSG